MKDFREMEVNLGNTVAYIPPREKYVSGKVYLEVGIITGFTHKGVSILACKAQGTGKDYVTRQPHQFALIQPSPYDFIDNPK